MCGSQEMDIIEAESRAIIDAVLDIGNGDPSLGTLKGIEAGIVEFHLLKHLQLRKAIPVRDANFELLLPRKENFPF